jgi:uracil phosphoribosyltransferase
VFADSRRNSESADPANHRHHATHDGGTPVLVSVLRAGNGLMEGVLRLLPDTDIGQIGLYRDHETLEAHQYMVRMPPIAGRHVIVVDPMLATGHSATAALDIVAAEQPASVVFMCLVAAPEGIAELQARHPNVDIVTAAIDSHLNEVGYIVPGLGDAGDRLYGT